MAETKTVRNVLLGTATMALLAFALLMAWSMMPTKTEAAVTAQVAPPPTRFVEQAFTP
ncbi:MAG: hypothetical protein HY681_09980, partial [Chloroflexi bacterium]|nr:hypothetical protein [Chloroflexota bacterium]